MSTSKAVADLQQKIKLQSARNDGVLRTMSRALKSKQEGLMELTHKNTELLDQIAKLTSKLAAMETGLGGGTRNFPDQKTLPSNYLVTTYY